MVTLVLPFLLSLGLSFLLTPLARHLAHRWGFTDKPDGRRKLHARAVPVAGGVAVLLASLTTVLVLVFTEICPWSEAFHEQASQWLGLAAASILIAGVGFVDDWKRLRGRHKLVGQLLAVAILIATGLVIDTVRIAGLEFDLGVMAIPFTALFLLGTINSLNLLDGMDGLLGTVSMIVILAFAGMAAMEGRWTTASVAVIVAGSVLGFLRYNLPPAIIYLGDAGSMLLGLVVGVLAVKSSVDGPASMALATPLTILAIPILDTLAAICRRKLTGRSIYTTDRGHLHHCLLRQGFSKVGALCVVCLFCLLTVAGAFLGVWLGSDWPALVTALSVAVLLVRLRWFGHGEALLVRERLKNLVGSLLTLRPSSGPMHSAICLQGSGNWTELWERFTQCAEALTLRTMRLDINAPCLQESFNARWDNCLPVDIHAEDAEAGPKLWNTALPLVWRGQTVGRLEVSGARAGIPVWRKIAALARLVDEIENAFYRIADPAGHGHRSATDGHARRLGVEAMREVGVAEVVA
jgi:UDP-GlcNAc:undecaprenyl-phosphate GlcNAc-1-phosphate transferase